MLMLCIILSRVVCRRYSESKEVRIVGTLFTVLQFVRHKYFAIFIQEMSTRCPAL